MKKIKLTSDCSHASAKIQDIFIYYDGYVYERTKLGLYKRTYRNLIEFKRKSFTLGLFFIKHFRVE